MQYAAVRPQRVRLEELALRLVVARNEGEGDAPPLQAGG